MLSSPGDFRLRVDCKAHFISRSSKGRSICVSEACHLQSMAFWVITHDARYLEVWAALLEFAINSQDWSASPDSDTPLDNATARRGYLRKTVERSALTMFHCLVRSLTAAILAQSCRHRCLDSYFNLRRIRSCMCWAFRYSSIIPDLRYFLSALRRIALSRVMHLFPPTE